MLAIDALACLISSQAAKWIGGTTGEDDSCLAQTGVETGQAVGRDVLLRYLRGQNAGPSLQTHLHALRVHPGLLRPVAGRAEKGSPLGCLLSPFVFIWRLLTLILEITGRLLAGLIGVALICAGIILSLTVFGVVAGVPLIIVGSALVLRALF